MHIVCIWVRTEEDSVADRLAPGDVGPGDVTPKIDDDPNLEPGFEATGDEDVDAVALWELGLGRPRVLSAEGRARAAQRWYDGDHGPKAPVAVKASATCSTCGYFVPMAGALRPVFGVCANEWSPDDGRVVLSAPEIGRALRRISHEILERNKGADDLVLLGIPTRGAHLARRLADGLKDVEGIDIPVGTLDVTMYRDDLRKHPTRAPSPTRIPREGIDGRTVVLVDDVLYRWVIPNRIDCGGVFWVYKPHVECSRQRIRGGLLHHHRVGVLKKFFEPLIRICAVAVFHGLHGIIRVELALEIRAGRG